MGIESASQSKSDPMIPPPGAVARPPAAGPGLSQSFQAGRRADEGRGRSRSPYSWSRILGRPAAQASSSSDKIETHTHTHKKKKKKKSQQAGEGVPHGGRRARRAAPPLPSAVRTPAGKSATHSARRGFRLASSKFHPTTERAYFNPID